MQKQKIKIYLIPAFIFLFAMQAGAQTITKVKYEYDAAGNRVKRSITHMRLNKPAELKDSIMEASIKLVPNPTIDNCELNISNFSDTLNYSLSVYDMTGRLILADKIRTEKTVLEMDELAAGTYNVLIANKNKSVLKKIIKSK